MKKTKQMTTILKNLGISSSALLVTTPVSDTLKYASRNIPKIKILPLESLNLLDVISFKHLAMTLSAVRKAEDIWDKGKNSEKMENS